MPPQLEHRLGLHEQHLFPGLVYYELGPDSRWLLPDGRSQGVVSDLLSKKPELAVKVDLRNRTVLVVALENAPFRFRVQEKKYKPIRTWVEDTLQQCSVAKSIPGKTTFIKEQLLLRFPT